MSELTSPPEETAGQHCARWLKSAKAKATETKTVLTWDEVAKIIDATLTGLNYFKHPASQPKARKKPVSQPAGPLSSEDLLAKAIYAAYPRKEAPKAAVKAILRAAHADAQVDRTVLDVLEDFLAKVKLYAQAVATWPPDDRRQYVPHPATWFNQGRYADDPAMWQRGSIAKVSISRDYSKLG